MACTSSLELEPKKPHTGFFKTSNLALTRPHIYRVLPLVASEMSCLSHPVAYTLGTSHLPIFIP
eukprot:12679736-Prorocentrum_lima.AAC.1